MPYLHIHLLGEFRLEYGDKLVSNVNTARLQSLLAYLLVHRQAPQPRQHVAFQLWPDSSERQAHTNLRKLLFQLRNALPDADSFLIQDHLTVQWRPDAACSLDVAELQTLLARIQQANDEQANHANHTKLKRIAQLYQGELLPSCLDEWIFPFRQQLHRDVMQALEQLVNLAEHQREYQAGIRYAQHLLGLDPLHEAAYRRLMQLHALNGDRAAALHDYHTCVTILEHELGVEPAEETHSLYQRILNMDEQPIQPPALLPEAPLIGRTAEWRTLLTTWRKAQRGQAHFVSIAGEAGIGKTRLAEEMIAWASAQGIRVAHARSYEAEGELAYAPVTEWLRSRPLKAGFKHLDKMWLTEMARLLPELLTEHAGLVPPAPLTETWQRQRFFEMLARAVLAEKAPLLLLIDDLQWCDPETLAWLRFLLRYDPQARLLVLGAWRSEAVDEAHPLRVLLRDLHNANQLTTLHLDTLTAEETAQLAQRIAETTLDTVEIQQLYQLTEGQPLFVVETVRARLRNRAGEPSGDGILAPIPLPSKVQMVIQARLAQLSLQARELAGLAATVGRRFTFAVLAQASQTDEEALVRTLDELWQRRIVREQGADAYDFSHDQIREVAYQGLSHGRRRLLHRRVAEALEIVYASSLDGLSAQLAAHYEQANRTARAARYWRRAGEHAAAKFAQLDAIRYFSRALDLVAAEEQAQRCDLLLARVKLYEHQGRLAEEQRDLNALQPVVAALDNTADALRRRAEFALCVAAFRTARNENESAYTLAQEAVALAEQCGADDLATRGHFMWAFADCGDYATYPAACARFEKALAMARTTGLYQIEAGSLDMLAAAGVYTGARINVIEAYARQALAVYQQHGDLPGEIAGLGRLAFIAAMQREGNYEQTIRDCHQALRLGSELAGWDAERTIVGCLGYLLYVQGDYAGALPHLERALTITQQGQKRYSVACDLLDIGAMYLDRGDYAKGKADLEEALRIYQEAGRQEQHIAKVLGFLALLYHYLDEKTQASLCGEEAARLARTLNDPRIEGDALTRCARVLVGQGRLGEAAELFQQALADFRQTDQDNHMLMPFAGLAEIALRQGELAQAQSWAERILTHLQTRQLDCTDEELYVYMTGYRVLRAAQDPRSAHLLQLAYQQLQTRAATLEDDHERRLFWSAPPHADVLIERKQKRNP